MTKPSQAQVREINRTLLATVRADWRFPDERRARAPTLEPLEYRERYYSTSEDDGIEYDEDHGEAEQSTSGSEDQSGDEGEDEEEASWSSPESEVDVNPLDAAGAAAAASRTSTRTAGRKGRKKRTTERKFSCPDDVAVYLDRKLQSRKRRKMKALTEEMSWNQGLCFFLRRRNAWTGALSQEEVKAKEKARSATAAPDEEPADETSNKSVNEAPEEHHTTSDTDSGIVVSPTTTPTTTQNPTPSPSSPFAAPTSAASLVNVLIPISIPFLPPSHPVRSSIMARTQSELYEKIVRDSRTPAVPLNLAHMMRVIVQGWKDEGNWPPKSSIAEQQQAMLASKKTKGKAAAANGKVSSAAGEGRGVGLFVGHKHLQRGVESVKRALRLSGSAAPAGD